MYRRLLFDRSKHSLVGAIARWNRKFGNYSKLTLRRGDPSSIRLKPDGAVNPAGPLLRKLTPGWHQAGRESYRYTNVIAYLLLGTEQYVDESRAFLESLDEAHARALWEAELANVFWMATRHGIIAVEEALTRLRLAESLGIHSVPNRLLWQGALVRAHQSRVAVYDTLFIELAVRQQLPLATFDASVDKSLSENRRAAR